VSELGWHLELAVEAFDKSYIVDPLRGCWLWQGQRDKNGYGRLSFRRVESQSRRETLAYRFAYEVANGIVPIGLELDHLCRIPSCVNPFHLEAVPHRINIKRGVRFWEKCPHGDDHRYERNRTCAVCRNARRRELYREGATNV
jgi:hypothetical protein